jgi:hypothetical protein
MVEIVGWGWDWELSMAQALWMVHGFTIRNHVPEASKPGRREGRGTFSEFLETYADVQSLQP